MRARREHPIGYTMPASVFLIMLVRAGGCSVGGGGQDNRPCITTTDNAWANNIEVPVVTLPVSCPIPVAFQGQLKPFDVMFRGVASSVGTGRPVQIVIWDALNRSIDVFEPPWGVYEPDASLSVARLSGNYLAGMVRTGFTESDRDTATLRSELFAFGAPPFAFAGVHLPYTFVAMASISGEETVDLGQLIRLRAEVENVLGPVTYQWWMNGQPYYQTGPNIDVVATSPGHSNL